jgi:multidrug resistance efflux pump
MAVGDCIPVTLCVPFQDFRVAVDVQARLVRVADGGGDIALQFIDLQPRARELLYYFSENLLRGEMAPIDGTIRRLDLPVTPPAPQAPKPAAAIEKRGRDVRAWLVGGGYAAAGIVLTAFLGMALYKSLFVVSAEQAMVYAPTVDLIGPDDGVVAEVYVREGDQVAAGDPLVDLQSTRLAQQLSEARIKEREANIEAERLDSLITQERNTLRPYESITADQLKAANARLASAQDYRALLERQRTRMQELINEGYVSTQELDKVETNFAMAVGAVTVAQSELQVARAAELAARSGRYYTSNRLEGKLPELQAELIAVRQRASLANARVRDLETQAAQLSLRAPLAGRVRQVPVVAGSVVSGGSLVVSLQTDSQPRVYAVVRSDRLARVTLGRRANVYVPAISRDLDAEVIGIEPRIWTLPDNVRRLLGNPADAGLVILAFNDKTGSEAFNPGLPVLVEVGGLSDTRGFQWLARAFGGGKTPERVTMRCPAEGATGADEDAETVCREEAKWTAPPDTTRS